jgi:hypothetical protein
MKNTKRLLHPAGTALAVGLLASNLPAAVGTLSGPFTHQNLQIFLVQGETRLDHRHYVTLADALAKGIVVVKETGNVQELTLENRSKELTVFLNAGDIVRGGRQDRTVRDDLILPPQSGEVALAAFCVEHGRWTRRGAEDASAFSSNTKVLSSRKEKMAARYGLSQSEVWSSVAEQQIALNANVSRLAGKPVDTRSAVSSSSLQLTLENKDLDAVKKQYLDALSHLLDGVPNAMGFVYAINGEINSADVYDNAKLFRALWPKLLDAAVTEAITERKTDRQFAPIPTADLLSFFQTALEGAIKERSVWKTTRVRVYTTPTTVLFETLDVDAGGAWLHKSFINKGKETVVVPLDREGLRNTPRQEAPLQQRAQ